MVARQEVGGCEMDIVWKGGRTKEEGGVEGDEVGDGEQNLF